jgi:hypothetical protein
VGDASRERGEEAGEDHAQDTGAEDSRTCPDPLGVVSVDVSVDVSRLSYRDLMAHYRRTAPVEDIRFTLRTRLSSGLRAAFEALGGLKRSSVYAQYVILQARWRAEHQRL